MKWSSKTDLLPGRQWIRKQYLDYVNVLRMILNSTGCVVNFKVELIHIASLLFTGKIEFSVPIY